MRSLPPVAALVAALLLPAPADAQGPPPTPELAISKARSLAEEGGTWLGVGPDYKARFEAGGPRFHPLLGGAVAGPASLRIAAEGAHRDGWEVTFDPGRAAHPTGDWAVAYPCAPHVEERYEVGLDGLWQSFVFDVPPGGSGDLVVGGRWVREGLATVDAGTTPPRFEASGGGGVTVGEVVGVDADGRRVPGELRLDGDRFELVLPEHLVESARYPLVLDPMIGTVQTVASFGNTLDCDVAYIAGEDLYLFVWERRYTALDVDIAGLRVQPDGTPVGILLNLEVSSEYAEDPAVGSVRSSQRFLVTWAQSQTFFTARNVIGRAVDADDGGLSAAIDVASGVFTQREPDVGGESTFADDDALVVWTDADSGIWCRQVTVPSAGDPSVLAAVQLDSTVGARLPAISKSGGLDGRYLVAWELPGTPSVSILARLISRNTALLTSVNALTSGVVARSPDVDGDGRTFLVVWDQEPAVGSGDRDVRGTTLTYTGLFMFTISGGSFPIAFGVADDEFNAAVGFSGEGFVVVWDDETGADDDLLGLEVDPITGTALEGQYIVSNSARREGRPAIATAYSGDPIGNDDSGFVAFESFDAVSGDGDIQARAFETELGLSIDFEGGCGDAGVYVTGSAKVGNSGFTHYLLGAGGSNPGFLVISGETLFFECGSCTLWPDPFSGFVVSTGTINEFGYDSYVTPIPNDPALSGASFYSQWVVVDGSPSCSTLSADLSNARRLILE